MKNCRSFKLRERKLHNNLSSISFSSIEPLLFSKTISHDERRTCSWKSSNISEENAEEILKNKVSPLRQTFKNLLYDSFSVFHFRNFVHLILFQCSKFNKMANKDRASRVLKDCRKEKSHGKKLFNAFLNFHNFRSRKKKRILSLIITSCKIIILSGGKTISALSQ